jgi:hypothetical protein
MPSCTTLTWLFLGAFVSAIAGNWLGVLAWRHRRPQLPATQWLRDPLYLLRSDSFLQPKSPLRLLALGVLTLGVVLLVALAALLIGAQRGGANSVCGFKF